ncbi:hypothetical protein Q5H92_08860 [Hymenobacter sp. M29]|uniref:Uncharacterized protein n=1 Tax=Hymenobacter mellowenesis TaxID=3063995 RepID=A0ABT9A9E6_9BACT|nr:hypothetical protein [Hymenobacter sp. M29]MDO7846465.1 hypothetical protein [Hymenobacter sp. M29]
MEINTHLTTEQIDALTPGPDTDMLVGRHLFRLQPYRPTNSGINVPGYQRKGSGGWAWLPRYSVDGPAMLELLGLLLAKKIVVDISSNAGEVRLQFRDRGRGGVDGVSARWLGTVNDLPLALCQAALKLPYL